MGIKDFFKDLFHRFSGELRRFPVAFGYTGVAFLCSLIYAFQGEGQTEDWLTWAVFACMLGFTLAVTVTLLIEKRDRPARWWMPLVCSLPFAMALFFCLEWEHQSVYAQMAGLGVIIAGVFCCCAFVCRGEKRGAYWARLVGSAVYCAVAAGIVCLGLELCLLATRALITGVSRSLDIVMLVFSGIVVGCNLFLSRIPEKGEEDAPSKAYRALTAYVLLPIYLLLLLILYVYIGKIIGTWKMPQGEMNSYGSFALLGFVFLWLSLQSVDTKLARFFVRWGGLLLVPVVAVQVIGIVIRVSAYGLTTARYLSMACVLLGVAAMVLSLLRKPMGIFFYLAAAVALLVTVTPLNARDVPLRQQTARLQNTLVSCGMLTENWDIVAPGRMLTKAEYEGIHGSREYLYFNGYGSLSPFAKGAVDSEIVRGIDAYYQENATEGEIRQLDFYHDASMPFNVDGYKRMYPVNSYDEQPTNGSHPVFHYTQTDTGETVDIELEPFLRQLLEDDGSGSAILTLPPEVDENWGLLFEYIYFQYDPAQDVFSGIGFQGYLLEK